MKNFIMSSAQKPYRTDIPKKTEELTSETKQMLKSAPVKIQGIKKISQLAHDHPVKKFVVSRKIPSDKHYLLYFAPKFYKFVNTLVENKFPTSKRRSS